MAKGNVRRIQLDDAALIQVWDVPADVPAPHRFRWHVTATFLERSGHPTACVEYRVLLLPDDSSSQARIRTWAEANARTSDDTTAWLDAHFTDAPGSGLPVAVLREASPARLLAKARQDHRERPGRRSTLSPAARALLAEPKRRAAGRPSTIATLTKLEILEAVQSGGTRADVAAAFNVAESTVRNTLSWARDLDPPLFTPAVPRGRSRGFLTADGQRVLDELRRRRT